MWTLIIVNLISGGFTTTTFQDFTDQTKCQNALSAIVATNKQLGTKPGVFEAICVAK